MASAVYSLAEQRIKEVYMWPFLFLSEKNVYDILLCKQMEMKRWVLKLRRSWEDNIKWES